MKLSVVKKKNIGIGVHETKVITKLVNEYSPKSC